MRQEGREVALPLASRDARALAALARAARDRDAFRRAGGRPRRAPSVNAESCSRCRPTAGCCGRADRAWVRPCCSGRCSRCSRPSRSRSADCAARRCVRGTGCCSVVGLTQVPFEAGGDGRRLAARARLARRARRRGARTLVRSRAARRSRSGRSPRSRARSTRSSRACSDSRRCRSPATARREPAALVPGPRGQRRSRTPR